MREVVQLNVVKQILTEYSDDIPLHFFLKDFYRKNKQFGSRDRKFYSEIVYKYLRCKTLFVKLPFEEKLYYSGFLTSLAPSDFFKYLAQANKISLPVFENWGISLEEKLNQLLLTHIISWENYFPASKYISDKIETSVFFKSHLSQTKFYIRVRNFFIEKAKQKLEEENIVFKSDGVLFEFESQIDISKYLPENSYEVQDLSSQATIQLFDIAGTEKVWDCCSGAGGKSLMLMDRNPGIQLYCSDSRYQILENLNTRFKKLDVQPKGVGVFDAVKKTNELNFNNEPITAGFFDVILADVPCSGSGTWGRNPERLYQFKELEVERYSGLQRSIVKNVLPYLKTGGKLIYITCSVYANENENNIAHFERIGLKLIKETYFIGYNKHADTLFGAVLEKV